MAGGRPPRADGRVKLFQAISLEADVNSAKVLAFSFPQLREGIARVEQAGSGVDGGGRGRIATATMRHWVCAGDAGGERDSCGVGE